MLTPPQAVVSAIVNFAPRCAKSYTRQLLLVGATLEKPNAVYVSSQDFPPAVKGLLDWRISGSVLPRVLVQGRPVAFLSARHPEKLYNTTIANN